MSEDSDERANELVRRSNEKRGYSPFWLDYMAAKDFEYLAGYEEHFEAIFDRETPLSPKFKELIVLAALAVEREDFGLHSHIRRAFALGASEAEIVNTFQVASWHTGALTLVHGMKVLLEIIEERKAGATSP